MCVHTSEVQVLLPFLPGEEALGSSLWHNWRKISTITIENPFCSPALTFDPVDMVHYIATTAQHKFSCRDIAMTTSSLFLLLAS